MPKPTRQARLIAALEAIGYARTPSGSTRYVEMRLGSNGRSLLKAGKENHRVFVGQRSPLWFVTHTMVQRIPECTVAALLDGALAPVKVAS